MKRRDFIKTIGVSCLGTCCNPLKVLAAGATRLKSSAGLRQHIPTASILKGSQLPASQALTAGPMPRNHCSSNMMKGTVAAGTVSSNLW